MFYVFELFMAEKSVGIILLFSKLESGIKFCAFENETKSKSSKKVFIIIKRNLLGFILIVKISLNKKTSAVIKQRRFGITKVTYFFLEIFAFGALSSSSKE
jgi:hypothetical protein